MELFPWSPPCLAMPVDSCLLGTFLTKLGLFISTLVCWQVLDSTVPNSERFIILLDITYSRGRKQCQKSHEQNTISYGIFKIWFPDSGYLDKQCNFEVSSPL